MTASLHTIIASDMHLSEAQESNPARPLWMAYKRSEFFIDDDFAAFLKHIDQQVDAPVELVLNGDIFDFDNILTLPEGGNREVDWLAAKRGLASEEWMSEFKMKIIIRDHPIWFDAVREFVSRGHRVVFVIGNHDAELHWPSVQRLVCDAIGVEAVFCDWFYLSGNDTYISHGHQYDANCTLVDPIHPFIEVHGRPRVRIPFGDLANRYMLNGMGYFNPHAPENYIMSATAYVRFFFRYMLKTQPLLIWTWFWGALVTLFVSLRDHWRHPMRDPLTIDDRVQTIAECSQTSPSVVRKLNAMHVPSASNNPVRILRELWLDRAFLLLAALFIAWEIILVINIAWAISPLWVLVPIAILLLPYIAYASSVRPTVFEAPLLTPERAELIFQITGVKRVVFGHTHKPECCEIGPVTQYNAGFWSPAFSEPECIHRNGTQTFVWIRPGEPGQPRQAELREWPIISEADSSFPRGSQSARCHGEGSRLYTETSGGPRPSE